MGYVIISTISIFFCRGPLLTTLFSGCRYDLSIKVSAWSTSRAHHSKKFVCLGLYSVFEDLKLCFIWIVTFDIPTFISMVA